MKAFWALMRREYLEHKAFFIYGPTAIIGISALAMALMFGAGRTEIQMSGMFDVFTGTLFEAAFSLLTALWWFYLLLGLFFYFPNSFAADARNNAMLFWKSMPQSDGRIIAAKFATGLALMPTLIFAAVLITGLIAYGLGLLAVQSLTGSFAFSFGQFILSYGEIAAAAGLFFVLGLLWYAPFFAWLGALGAIFGRWAIAVSIFTPAALIVLETAIVPLEQNRRIYAFLVERTRYMPDEATLTGVFTHPPGSRLGVFANSLLHSTSWTQMIIGWAFSALVLYAASQYRRRTIQT